MQLRVIIHAYRSGGRTVWNCGMRDARLPLSPGVEIRLHCSTATQSLRRALAEAADIVTDDEWITSGEDTWRVQPEKLRAQAFTSNFLEELAFLGHEPFEVVPEFEPAAALSGNALVLYVTPERINSGAERAVATRDIVDTSRLKDLQALQQHPDFDCARLVRLCEELSDSFARGNYHATAMLTRAILDHVPPIFSCTDFTAVANNYSGAGRSFKSMMKKLNADARHVADAHLHLQIRRKESLPNATQVDFSQALDMLLSEVIRVLGARPGGTR